MAVHPTEGLTALEGYDSDCKTSYKGM